MNAQRKWWTEQDKIVLRCLLGGPKWAGEIAVALGFTKWSQIPNGMYHGDRLAKFGLCQRARCPDRRRVMFTITEAGRNVLTTDHQS